MTPKNDCPFVVVDGVPRPIVSEALRYAAREVVSKARQELLTVFKNAHYRITNPNGRAGSNPEPDQIDQAIADLMVAREVYVKQWKIACDTMQRALDLDEPEDDPPPAPEEAEV